MLNLHPVLMALNLGSSWDWDMALRLLLAAALGGAIGVEREVHGQSAGLRTQMLVAIGSALAMVISLHFADAFGQADTPQSVHVDPTRAAYGVLTGIGFLGAGAILHHGSDIRGLTTAASLWCSAVIGLASGFGMYLLACVATALVLFILAGLELLDRVLPQHQDRWLTFIMPGGAQEVTNRLREVLSSRGLRFRDVHVEYDREKNLTSVSFHLRLMNPDQVQNLFKLADEVQGVRHVKIE